ncbi:SDR family NAD(P)-dependent oxidoreductase [bacterium]|nr:SDR family NAD(P)-dependent oxidoreductase [bacterium]
MTATRPGDVIIITGASTGIGLSAAIALAERGYRIAAGVRNGADADRLRAIHDRIEPIIMDVTDPGTLCAAATAIGIAAGLIVNAGIAVAGPVELIDLGALERVLAVNVVGAAATVQAFLPLLRPHGGRVIMMSSVSGRMSVPVLGPYAASKHALEALSDALRLEVSGQDIEVAILEPGSVTTPIWGKASSAGDTMLGHLDERAVERYGGFIGSVRAKAHGSSVNSMAPETVARVITTALEACRPRTRYTIGTRVRLQVMLSTLLPDRWFDRIKLRAMRPR